MFCVCFCLSNFIFSSLHSLVLVRLCSMTTLPWSCLTTVHMVEDHSFNSSSLKSNSAFTMHSWSPFCLWGVGGSVVTVPSPPISPSPSLSAGELGGHNIHVHSWTFSPRRYYTSNRVTTTCRSLRRPQRPQVSWVWMWACETAAVKYCKRQFRVALSIHTSLVCLVANRDNRIWSRRWARQCRCMDLFFFSLLFVLFLDQFSEKHGIEVPPCTLCTYCR